MEFPPPPGNAFLAYISGSISRSEFLELTKLWEDKHANRNGDTVLTDTHTYFDMDTKVN